SPRAPQSGGEWGSDSLSPPPVPLQHRRQTHGPDIGNACGLDPNVTAHFPEEARRLHLQHIRARRQRAYLKPPAPPPNTEAGGATLSHHRPLRVSDEQTNRRQPTALTDDASHETARCPDRSQSLPYHDPWTALAPFLRRRGLALEPPILAM